MTQFWTKAGSFLKGILGAIVGVVLVIVVLHIYQDHQAFHQLAAFINVYSEKITKLP